MGESFGRRSFCNSWRGFGEDRCTYKDRRGCDKAVVTENKKEESKEEEKKRKKNEVESKGKEAPDNKLVTENKKETI